MAYDKELAGRIQRDLGTLTGLEEKKMFGGVGFMLHGNMAWGVHQDNLVVRLDPRRSEKALSKPHVQPFTRGGRSMAGWVVVTPPGCKNDSTLEGWIQHGLDYAGSLPPK
jgi:TfoX/Sxy family transcriptional regulator of competence genes